MYFFFLAEKSHLRYPMEMKRKQPHEMIESKEAKLQVETAAEFDANENVEPSQQQHSAQQPHALQQPAAIKQDQNAAAAVQHHDHDSEPKISHAQVHDISHGEPVIINNDITVRTAAVRYIRSFE